MFSSFSNMLPNLALPGGGGPDTAKDNQATPTPTSINPFDRLLAVKRRFVPTSSPISTETTPVTAEPESGATTPAADTDAEHEARSAAAARKKKPLNETFVVVRPPPSVSNHPLNLQLQLIPPKAEAPQHQPRSASTSTTGSTSSAGGGYSGAGGVPNVPPVSAGLQSRKETARQAGGVPESPAEDNELTRVRTNRSDLSQFYSSIGSSASVQSFSTVASTSTSAGGSSRRIIPLYNLSAHNVLQNTVQDAGTDATVSRFRKRGIDVVGLGVLEPVEVWGNAPLGGPGGYGPVDESASDAGHGTAPSADDHSTTHNYSPPKQIVQLHSREVSDSAPVTPKESGTKKLFGKLFKKKDTTGSGGSGSAAASPAGTPTTMLSPPTPARTSFGRDRPASLYSNGGPAGVPSTPATPVTPTVSTSLAPPLSSAGTYLQAPVLGTQATLRSDIYPPTGRASAYVWVLRRWTKGGGMFAGLAGAVGASGGGLDMSRAGVEVRFEWVRGRKRRRAGRGEASESGAAAAASADPSRTVGTGRRIRGGGSSRPVSVVDRPVSVLSVGGGDGLDFSTVASESLSVPGPLAGRAPSVIASERSVSPDARRRSVDSSHTRSRRGSKRSMSPMKKGAMARNDSGSSREREECEEDSDPEDSETPWSCTLRVLPLELPPPPSSDDLTTPTAPVDPSLPTGLKLRLAHLVPAPHHPKVIGQFKMPFPLPDVSVSRMELVPRAPGDMFGLGGEGGGRVGVGRGEMVMTAEEIKDVVSTTGLWLMVREGFGGLGGKKRKGDGWKIRS